MTDTANTLSSAVFDELERSVLGRRYGVAPRTITFIRRGETWKHVV